MGTRGLVCWSQIVREILTPARRVLRGRETVSADLNERKTFSRAYQRLEICHLRSH